MRAKNNGIGRWVGWFTVHTKRMELVQLLELASLPLGPGVKSLQLATSEGTKGLFSRGSGGGLDGMDSGGRLE